VGLFPPATEGEVEEVCGDDESWFRRSLQLTLGLLSLSYVVDQFDSGVLGEIEFPPGLTESEMRKPNDRRRLRRGILAEILDQMIHDSIERDRSCI
jgi:hypothetical protein